VKFDLVLAGVGGQGVLSLAAIISSAAVAEGLHVRQSEVHGMAQRGGAVLAHMRISSEEINSDLVPRGAADMILAMEPLEGLRYAVWLSPKGTIVSAAEPFINIPNYPEIEGIHSTIRAFPSFRIVETAALAREAGLNKAVNMVMAGAASPFLPIKTETLEGIIAKMFAQKEKSVVEANIKAFNLGRNFAEKS